MLVFRIAAPALLIATVSLHAQPPATTPAAAAPVTAADIPYPIPPVHQDPHHRQLFRFETTRILELQLPPGDASLYHSHEWPVLYVTLSNSPMRTQTLGADQAGRDGAGRAAGAAAAGGRGGRPGGAGAAAAAPASPRPTSTTSYIERPVTHIIENTGDRLVRAVVVVNETKGDETTTEQAAGFEAKPELTNAWFRAYRVALRAGQKTLEHRHQAPVVIVQATAGQGVARGPMTFELNTTGQWAFFDRGVPHELHNTGSGALELIEVEVRRK